MSILLAMTPFNSNQIMEYRQVYSESVIDNFAFLKLSGHPKQLIGTLERLMCIRMELEVGSFRRK